jgi:thiol-disulfide isomerase/thioredoxin
MVALCGLAAWAAAEAAPKKKLWAKSFLGQPAPAFSVQKWVTAEPAREGKFVLLDFWATWCPPCRKAVDELNDLHAKFGDRLVVIGISDEDVGTVRDFTTKKIKYFSAVDEEAVLKKKYEVEGVPHVVIINPAGTVVWEGFPFLPGHELTEAVVADLLKAGGANAPAP